jgi:hypothetical protein
MTRRRDMPARTPVAKIEAVLSVKPLDTRVVNRQTLPPQQYVNASVAHPLQFLRA